MPSESVEAFLDLAKSNRLLQPDFLDDLTRRPDAPHGSLAALCDYLQGRGDLTAYQADRVRAGKGAELTFAGYPVTDDLGPCPGGTAFAALHPAERVPVVVRRLRAAAAAIDRAQAAAALAHPNLTRLIDTGSYHDEPFAVLEPFGGADLGTLVGDIGAMPALLAATYAGSVAQALAAVHGHGLTHGDVRPGNVRVGPLVPMSRPRADGTPRFRPAPTAVVQLAELGLVPHRPPAAHDPDLPAEAAAYLPPERIDGDAVTPAGDVYGLGATLYFLLTARPPYPEPATAAVVAAVRAGPPTPLAALRPDAPAELVSLVNDLTAADPAARPSAAVAAVRLATLVAPPPPPPEPEPAAPPHPSSWVAVPFDGPAEADTFTPAAFPGWPSEGELHGIADRQPPPPARAEDGKPGHVWIWVAVGAGLWALAMVLWVVYFLLPG